ncbi:MAG: DinB family protein [Ignavibacterium sp.]|uniref:DinB family protein n=1 Tax=Ignavibacterium sp. TaxID=2651167 RepID=UPI00404B50AD
MLTIKQLKDNFISDSESFLFEIKKLNELSDDQLNWKTTEDSWSIAECIEHLSITNQLYFDKIEKQLSETQINCRDEEIPVKHSFWGKMIIKVVDPSNIKKTKTFSVFQPSKNYITKDSITKLIEVQKSLTNLISSSVNLNTNRYSMSSPASKLIKVNLSDILEIIRLHNKRHLIQIEKLLINNNFPKD